MSVVEFVPLAVALAALCLPLLAPVSRRANLLLTRVAIPLFESYVTHESPRRRRQREAMRAAHVGVTHRAYASRTLLTAGVAGVAGGVVGVYLAAYVVDRLTVTRTSLREALPPALSFLADAASAAVLGLPELFGLLLFSGVAVGATLGLGVYWYRWASLDHRASARAARIDATLPRTIAFVYALSRSGVSFPRVLRTLGRNEAVYGEAARELGVAVRDAETFGTDVLTALREVAATTPSDDAEEFAENLASVLSSGRNVSDFLHGQYERYQAEAEAAQEQYLELLSTFAEVYVTVLVAGPLFLVTILAVVGLVLEDTLWSIRVVTYAGIPLATAAFVAYLDDVTRARHAPDPGTEAVNDGADAGAGRASGRPGRRSERAAAADGGGVEWETARERLGAYDRAATVRAWLDRPAERLLAAPHLTFLVTAPLGLAWVVFRLRGTPPTLPALAAAVDTPLVEAVLVALAGYGLAFEVRRRRTRGIEEAVPDFLDRLASLNEAGVTVVQSVRRVADTDLGALDPELDRTVRDLDWGAELRAALARLDRRTRTPAVSRSVALVSNATAASGDVAPVLRIAANEAQESRRLRRSRRQEMLTYLLVIYISFVVFLGIIAALQVAFVPAVEAASASAATTSSLPVSGGTFAGLREVNTAAYTRLFFHVSAVQAVCSGVAAGQLGEGDFRAGVKHAVLLLALSYALFLFV